MKSVLSKSPKDTEKLGRRIASFFRKGDVVALVGDLGSGKTTLAKGIALGLGIKTAGYVNSPSFVIINEYNGRLPLYHMDLYRLEDISAIESAGCRDYIGTDGVCVIEWAEKMAAFLPAEHMRIEICFKGKKQRLFKFIPKGSRYDKLAEKIK